MANGKKDKVQTQISRRYHFVDLKRYYQYIIRNQTEKFITKILRSLRTNFVNVLLYACFSLYVCVALIFQRPEIFRRISVINFCFFLIPSFVWVKFNPVLNDCSVKTNKTKQGMRYIGVFYEPGTHNYHKISPA